MNDELRSLLSQREPVGAFDPEMDQRLTQHLLRMPDAKLVDLHRSVIVECASRLIGQNPSTATDEVLIHALTEVLNLSKESLVKGNNE